MAPEGVQQIDIELGSPQDLSNRILANVWCDASGLLASCVRCHGDDGTASPERGRVDFVERVACLVMQLPILRGIDPSPARMSGPFGSEPLERCERSGSGTADGPGARAHDDGLIRASAEQPPAQAQPQRFPILN